MTFKRALRLGFGLLIWVGLIAALVAGWDSARDTVSDSLPIIVAAVPLVLLGLLGAAQGWAVLQPPELRPRALRAFLAAQPAKYLPGGGAFQLVGQVGMTSATQSDRSRVGVTFAVHAFIQAVSASSVALLILASGRSPSIGLTLVIAGAAIGFPLLLRQSVLELGIRLVERVVSRLDLTGSVPPTSTLWQSWAWSLLPLLLTGLAFALLAAQGVSAVTLLSLVGAFAAAWLAGFLVFPLPSGLGVREVVLVLLLPAIPSSQVIATSVLHRFSTLLAEVLVLIVVSRRAFSASDSP